MRDHEDRVHPAFANDEDPEDFVRWLGEKFDLTPAPHLVGSRTNPPPPFQLPDWVRNKAVGSRPPFTGQVTRFLGWVDGRPTWELRDGENTMTTRLNMIHHFQTTGEAYDACQCDETITSGDVLVILPEGVVGIADTWPVAVTLNHGNLPDLECPWPSASQSELRDRHHPGQGRGAAPEPGGTSMTNVDALRAYALARATTCDSKLRSQGRGAQASRSRTLRGGSRMKTYWHKHNPWAAHVVYVPIEKLARCVAGGTITGSRTALPSRTTRPGS